MKQKTTTKEKIVEALEGIKEFNISFIEEVTYSKVFKATSEEALQDKFHNGELDFEEKDIIDGNFCDGSLEINEVENDT